MLRKTSLSSAIATLLIVGLNPANAKVPVYENEGFTFSMGGDFEVQYRKRTDKDRDPEIEYDDMEIHFFADYDFSDNLSAFGRVDLDFKGEIDSDENAKVLDKAYIGFNISDFTIGVGKTDYVTDDFNQSYDYEMGGQTAFDTTGGDDVVFMGYEPIDGLELRASFDVGEKDNGVSDESSFDMLVVYEMSQFEFGAAYQHFSDSDVFDNNSGNIIKAESMNTVGLYIKGEFGDVETFLAYSNNDIGDYYQLGAEYKINDNWGVGGGVETLQADVNDADVDLWYANVTYSFNKNVKLFAEVGDESGDDNEFGGLTGFRVRF